MGVSRKKSQTAAAKKDWRSDVFPLLLPLLVFLTMTAISGQFAVGFVVLALVLTVGREPLKLAGERACLVTAAVVVYCGLYLCSGLWSHFGDYAQEESVKTLIALTMFGLVIFRLGKDKVRTLLWSLNGVLALVGLLCIEASSTQVLTNAFSTLMKLFSSGYYLDTMGYEVGVRITGIYSNANVSAGILAFGLIVALYLLQTEEKEGLRLVAGVTLGVQALAFFLSFSMGAMAAFAVTCLVYLLCAGRENRLRLFLLMVESVLVTLACAFGAYGSLGKGSILPVVLALVCGLGIWALDRFVGQPLAASLANRGKAVGVAIGALAALMAVYGVLAMNVTGPIALPEGNETLSRAVALEGGDHAVVELGSDNPVSAVIYSQNDQELMMHTNTVLYQGDLAGASFTVPEDSQVVWFVMRGEGQVHSLILDDGIQVPLGYPLLPGFAANRLQALWANQNFIQRLVFFRDGLELWKQSPVIGWGAGGVEGQLTAVQDFYYESKYIHNHFIQILDEAGILGLAAFLFLLGSAIWTLLRRRKEERDPLFAMLAASLAMMISHSMTEVVWSTQMYQVVVFLLLAVLVIRYGAGEESSPKALSRAVPLALGVVVAVFGLLQGGSLLASYQLDHMNVTSQEEAVSALGTMDLLEVYDDSDYKVNRMVNALQMGDAGTAAKCAAGLLAKEEFDACYYTAAYYYLPLGQLPQFFEATRTGLAQEASNPDAWSSIFNLYRSAFKQLGEGEMEAFVAGVTDTGDLLDQRNGGAMEAIRLSAANQALLDCAVQIRQQQLTGAAAQAILAAALAG